MLLTTRWAPSTEDHAEATGGNLSGGKRNKSVLTYYTFNMNHDDDDDMVDTTHSFSVTLHLISDHKDTTKKNKLPSEGIDGVQVQYLLIGPSSWLIGVGQANLIALQRTKSIIMADEYTPKSFILRIGMFRILTRRRINVNYSYLYLIFGKFTISHLP